MAVIKIIRIMIIAESRIQCVHPSEATATPAEGTGIGPQVRTLETSGFKLIPEGGPRVRAAAEEIGILPNPGNWIPLLECTADAAGNIASRTADCSSGCNWLVNTAEYNIHRQMVAQDGLPTQGGGQSSQEFAYDGVGRLAEVTDTVSGQCETRRYEFDADSNRTATKIYAPGNGGQCSTAGAPEARTNSFDAADRITNSGYEYDSFGRTTKVPQADAGGTGDLTATYYANDLARSIPYPGGPRGFYVHVWDPHACYKRYCYPMRPGSRVKKA